MRPSSVALLLCVLGVGACNSPKEPSASSGGASHSGGALGAGGGALGTANPGGAQGNGGTSAGGAGAPLGGLPMGGTNGAAGAGGAMNGGTTGAGGGPSITFLYVASGAWDTSEEGKVTVFKLNRGAASLERVSEVPAGGLASFMAFDFGRHRAFVADEKNGGLVSFSVDPATGKLTSLGATAHSNHPVNFALSRDGKFLLGANYNEGSVDVYPIGDDGKALASSQTLETGSHAHCVMFDPDGRVLVANEGEDTISHLTFVSGSLAPGTPASSESFSPRHMALGRDDKLYVVSERGDFITAYARESSGALGELWQEERLDQGVATDNTGADIHLDPSGRFLYATNRGTSNTVVAFDISGESPARLGYVSSEGVTPRNFSIDPEGQFLVVGNHGATKTLAIFSIGADGKLKKENVIETDFSPYFVSLVQFR
jgi:6-phosphogluconolactonase